MIALALYIIIHSIERERGLTFYGHMDELMLISFQYDRFQNWFALGKLLLFF